MALLLAAACVAIVIWAASDDVVVWLMQGACRECHQEQGTEGALRRSYGSGKWQQSSGAAVWERFGAVIFLVARQRHGDTEVVCDLTSPCWDRCTYVPSAFAADSY